MSLLEVVRRRKKNLITKQGNKLQLFFLIVRKVAGPINVFRAVEVIPVGGIRRWFSVFSPLSALISCPLVVSEISVVCLCLINANSDEGNECALMFKDVGLGARSLLKGPWSFVTKMYRLKRLK